MSSERILYIHTKKRQEAWLLVSKRKTDTHATPQQNTGNARRKSNATKQKDGGKARKTFFFSMPADGKNATRAQRENREKKRRKGRTSDPFCP